MAEEKFKHKIGLIEILTKLGEIPLGEDPSSYCFYEGNQKKDIYDDISRRSLRVKDHIYRADGSDKLGRDQAKKFLEKTIEDKVRTKIETHYIQRILQRPHEVLAARLSILSGGRFMLRAPEENNSFLSADTGYVTSTQSHFLVTDTYEFERDGSPKVIGYIQGPIHSSAMLTEQGYKTEHLQTDSDLIQQLLTMGATPADMLAWLKTYPNDFQLGKPVYAFSDLNAEKAMKELQTVADKYILEIGDTLATIKKHIQEKSLSVKDLTTFLKIIEDKLTAVHQQAISAKALKSQIRGGERIIAEEFDKLDKVLDITKIRKLLSTEEIAAMQQIFAQNRQQPPVLLVMLAAMPDPKVTPAGDVKGHKKVEVDSSAASDAKQKPKSPLPASSLLPHASVSASAPSSSQASLPPIASSPSPDRRSSVISPRIAALQLAVSASASPASSPSAQPQPKRGSVLVPKDSDAPATQGASKLPVKILVLPPPPLPVGDSAKKVLKPVGVKEGVSPNGVKNV